MGAGLIKIILTLKKVILAHYTLISPDGSGALSALCSASLLPVGLISPSAGL